MDNNIEKIYSLLEFYKDKGTEVKFNHLTNKNFQIRGKIDKLKTFWTTPHVIVGDIKIFLEDIDIQTIMPADVKLESHIAIYVRTSLPQKIRFEVFKRDNFTCQYCGRSPPEVKLEPDHIKPLVDGGTDELSNLVTSCFDCNRGKGAST